jgi:hypothetical protein
MSDPAFPHPIHNVILSPVERRYVLAEDADEIDRNLIG